MLRPMLLSLTLVLHVLPTHQLGGGCLLGDRQFQEEIALNYLEEFPVKTSPSVQAVHLALKGSEGMLVTWMNPTTWSSSSSFSPVCSYGVSATSLTVNVTGMAYSYPDGHFIWTLNSAILNLKSVPSQSGVYFYRCGDPKYGWSQVFNFTLQPANARQNLVSKSVSHMAEMAPKIAIVGDWGVKRGEYTMERITDLVTSDEVQLVVHAGDISYANKYGGKTQNNSGIWVEYMNRLQPMMSRVPYMVSPGNHESQFKFAAFLNWVKMPSNESSSTSPFWYSFDYMGIHFVSISTEHDFSHNSTQYNWIVQDLKKANQNRDNVPWIMVFGHRPLYCSSIACKQRCEVEAPEYRAKLEDLFYYQHVDVYMSGHNHQYERSYPVYKGNIDHLDYKNPRSPVYVVNGAAGCPELNDPTFMPSVNWRAFDEANFDTGFVLLEPSKGELKFTYILSKANKIADSFTISKTQ